MAVMISLVALSIDTILPALPAIGSDLNVVRPNGSQLTVSLLFLGMACGQLFYGPVSDSVGRKPAIYAGLAIFIAGCLISLFSTSFPVMLGGRFLQGIGVAGPRIVAVALVRDQYQGRAMARVMSFIMAVFIVVPAVAPAIGQALLWVAHWRAIFVAFLVLALVALVWFALRQPETLPVERRASFSLPRILRGVREVCLDRTALGYSITSGLIFGAFVGYLSSAQAVFQGSYGLGNQFPAFFAVLALSVGGATYVNAHLVMRFGMQLLSGWAVRGISVISISFLAITFWQGGLPPFWAFMSYFVVAFFGIGILFGNLNALAMEPLGHIAGIGAAVVASLSLGISMPLGMFIGLAYDGTVLPLVGGFAVLGVAAWMVMGWTVAGARCDSSI